MSIFFWVTYGHVIIPGIEASPFSLSDLCNNYFYYWSTLFLLLKITILSIDKLNNENGMHYKLVVFNTIFIQPAQSVIIY